MLWIIDPFWGLLVDEISLHPTNIHRRVLIIKIITLSITKNKMPISFADSIFISVQCRWCHPHLKRSIKQPIIILTLSSFLSASSSQPSWACGQWSKCPFAETFYPISERTLDCRILFTKQNKNRLRNPNRSWLTLTKGHFTFERLAV